MRALSMADAKTSPWLRTVARMLAAFYHTAEVSPALSEPSAGFRVDFINERILKRGAVVRISRMCEALAVYLGTRQGAPTREAVADALWPELDGDAALNALKSCLHRLRIQLNDCEFVVIESGRLRVRASFSMAARAWLDQLAAITSLAERNAAAMTESDRSELQWWFKRLSRRTCAWKRYPWFSSWERSMTRTFRAIGAALTSDALLHSDHGRALELAGILGEDETDD